MIPTLHTERLTLRPYQRADFGAYADFMESENARFMDGPVDRDTAWTWFTNDVASWALYGFGCLAVVVDGKLAGGVGLVHPPHFPEAECGWFIYEGFTGAGLAAEAARAVLDYSFAQSDLGSVVSYISPENAASIKVAKALGGVLDPDAARPANDDCLVYRHQRVAA